MHRARTRVVAIVQARMGSTRLPGKVLRPVAGKPLLWHIVHRLRGSLLLEDIAVATTVNPADEAIVEWCNAEGITVVRGPEDLRRIFERRNDERREFMERYTAFRDANWEPRVDYRTKRGLLVEIDASALEAEREATAVQKAKKLLRPRATEGPIEEN